MIKKIFPSLFTLVIVATMFLAQGFVIAHAQTNSNSGGGTTTTTGGGGQVQSGLNDISGSYPEGVRGNNQDVKSVTKKVIDWALYLAAIVAVIFIIIGGYMYITSAGDQTKAGKGRQTLVNALIGLTMVVLSYLIVQIVYNFLIRP